VFKAVLEKGHRVQVPRIVRWQFKLETNQVLCVTVRAIESFVDEERFYARMRSDGRITIPKLTRRLLQDSMSEKQSLQGAVLERQLEPTEPTEST
jgi:bifunctional DNA-binding transcriptional regulator/antitoxin component of YhaV-PrlF toxin-antitoxin module